MLPYFHEIILVDVALMIIGTDAGTGGDGTIHQDRTHRYASLARIKMIANVALIIAHEALTAVAAIYQAFLASELNKLQDASVFFGG